MEFLSALWMPIVVSAVVVFFASFITHTILPHHKSEFKKLPNEDAVLSTAAGAPPELYMFPFPASMADMKSPEFIAKTEKGPNGMLIIWPKPVNKAENLAMTFLFYVVVGVFIAYLGWHSIDAGSTYLHRFRICGTIAFAAHGLGWMSYFIWFRYGRFWPNFFDSVIFALLTAGVFAWLWPK